MEMIMDDMSFICVLVFDIMILGIILNKLQGFYSSFQYMSLVFLDRISIIRKITAIPTGQLEPVTEKQAAEARTASAEDLALKPSLSCKNLDGEIISLEEVKVMIEKVTDSSEIVPLFDEGLSEAEVIEAFGLFDKNKDGFIDAKELRNLLCSLGYTEASESDCKKMINAFDIDRDGRIDFNEFVKLLGI